MNTKKDNVTPCSQSIEPYSSVEIYERWMTRCLTLAKEPGWKAHIWWTVKDLDADQSGLFTGFKEDFLRRVKDGSVDKSD
jgi:hypothetical protein